MTTDVIALTEAEPDRDALLHALDCAGPRAKEIASSGELLRLLGPDHSAVLALRTPRWVGVPGEVARMLGADQGLPDAPVWWTEARSHLDADRAHRVCGTFASRLVERAGGRVWPAAARIEDHERAAEPGPLPAVVAEQPAVHEVTRLTASVTQDRPVVGVSDWLLNALDAVEASVPRRTLYLLTPPGTRLTLPLYEMLAGHALRWLIPDGDHFYDGRSGLLLSWQGRPGDTSHQDDRDYRKVAGRDGRPLSAEVWRASAKPYFGAVGPGASGELAFAATPQRRLSLRIRTRHTPSAALRLGATAEAAWTALTGRPPAGWGTGEPVGDLWSIEELTALARERAPEPSRLVIVGHQDQPAIATLRITRDRLGVEQDLSVTFGYERRDDVPDQRRLTALAEELSTGHGLRTMRVLHRAASADLLVAPPLPGSSGPPRRGRRPEGGRDPGRGVPGRRGRAAVGAARRRGGGRPLLPAGWPARRLAGGGHAARTARALAGGGRPRSRHGPAGRRRAGAAGRLAEPTGHPVPAGRAGRTRPERGDGLAGGPGADAAVRAVLLCGVRLPDRHLARRSAGGRAVLAVLDARARCERRADGRASDAVRGARGARAHRRRGGGRPVHPDSDGSPRSRPGASGHPGGDLRPAAASDVRAVDQGLVRDAAGEEVSAVPAPRRAGPGVAARVGGRDGGGGAVADRAGGGAVERGGSRCPPRGQPAEARSVAGPGVRVSRPPRPALAPRLHRSRAVVSRRSVGRTMTWFASACRSPAHPSSRRVFLVRDRELKRFDRSLDTPPWRD
ncbi:DUF6177 family protein [Streptomyces profundus]|nr:DUF6177 family protein [Streptomyces sp. MA3_2.13]